MFILHWSDFGFKVQDVKERERESDEKMWIIWKKEKEDFEGESETEKEIFVIFLLFFYVGNVICRLLKHIFMNISWQNKKFVFKRKKTKKKSFMSSKNITKNHIFFAFVLSSPIVISTNIK